MSPTRATTHLPARLGRLIFGLFLFGIGGGMGLAADLGVSPWHVFHQGVARTTGISVGTTVVLVGGGILLLWIPLRQKVGIGTILNAIVIGPVIDVTLRVLPSSYDSTVARWVLMLGGIVAIGIGSGFYLGAELGPGPRDGLMTGIAQRGFSLRVARTAVEALALLGGMALGGKAGIGTIVFVLGIGPTVQFFLKHLAFTPAPPTG